jgi:hypothetical protein
MQYSTNISTYVVVAGTGIYTAAAWLIKSRKFFPIVTSLLPSILWCYSFFVIFTALVPQPFCLFLACCLELLGSCFGCISDEAVWTCTA